MLVLERARRDLLDLPILAQAGLTMMAIGLAADVVVHLLVTGPAEALIGHDTSELAAHLIGFVGMVVTLAGVVLDGARRSLRGRKA